jgi:hypothetical protein
MKRTLGVSAAMAMHAQVSSVAVMMSFMVATNRSHLD